MTVLITWDIADESVQSISAMIVSGHLFLSFVYLLCLHNFFYNILALCSLSFSVKVAVMKYSSVKL